MSFLGRRPTVVQPARVLTAAGRKIDLSQATQKKPTGSRSSWQADAWGYRDSIGEIRYAVGYLRHACSRVRLFPAVAAGDNQPPTPLAEAKDVPPDVLAAANDALTRLTSGTFQYAELLSPFAENLEIAGEAMLVGYESDGAEVWGIHSRDELQQTDSGWQLVDAEGAKDGIRLDPATSYLSRLWHPHPRWRSQADSPMRALLGPCEELQLVARAIRSAARSRLAGAGLLAMPEEMTFRTKRKPGDINPEDLDDDPFLTDLTQAMVTPIEDEGDASAVVPMLVTGPGDVLEKIKHISFAIGVDDKLLDRQEAALKRIAMGLDVPPEIVTGVADVNHWTAWQVDDSTLRNHVAPLVVRMVDGLTAGYLRPVLKEYGLDPAWADRIVVWFDTSPLSARVDRSKDAILAWDRNVISDRALVESLGFDAETDMATPEELVNRLAMKRGAMDGSITEAILKMVIPDLDNLRHIPAGQITVHNGQDAQDAERENPSPAAAAIALPATSDKVPDEEEEPADQGEEDSTTPSPTTGLPASAAPARRTLSAHTRASRRLTDIDRMTRDRIATAADAALTRAVERAGNRVRSAANRDADLRAQVASVPPARVAAALGPQLVAGIGLDIEELLTGAWEDLAKNWFSWTATAQEEALRTAAEISGQDPEDDETTSTLEQLTSDLTELASSAWEWLSGALTDMATALLYDPESEDDVAVEQGEDRGRRGRVTSLARGAMTIAGGVPAGHPGVTTEGLPVEPGTPPSGIAGGDVVNTYLRESGQAVIGYEWIYGISEKHFKPHRDLDGVIFADFASPVLDNPQSWPAAILAPGDHRGCHCDASPVWADGTLSSDDQQAAADATYDDSYLRVLQAMADEDTKAGRSGTSAQTVAAEAQRVARARPSRRST